MFKAIGVRLIEHNLEADLYLLPRSDGDLRVGELEYKIYQEGDSKFEIELPADLDVPSGAPVLVFVDGNLLYELETTGSKIDIEVKRTAEQTLRVDAGSSVRVDYVGKEILEGVLEKKFGLKEDG